MNVRARARACVCVCVYVCVCVCVCVHMHTRVHIHVYVCVIFETMAYLTDLSALNPYFACNVLESIIFIFTLFDYSLKIIWAWVILIKRLKPTPARSSPDPEPGRKTSYQHSVFDWLPAQSSFTRRGPDLQQHRQELSPLKNKTSVTLQWIPSHCSVGSSEEPDSTGCQKWEVSWSNLHTPCRTVKQRQS